MAHLHISRSVSIVRAYDRPDGYELQLPFHAIVTVKHLGDDEAFLEGAHGELKDDELPELFAMLKEMGVHTVTMKRHRRKKTYHL